MTQMSPAMGDVLSKPAQTFESRLPNHCQCSERRFSMLWDVQRSFRTNCTRSQSKRPCWSMSCRTSLMFEKCRSEHWTLFGIRKSNVSVVWGELLYTATETFELRMPNMANTPSEGSQTCRTKCFTMSVSPELFSKCALNMRHVLALSLARPIWQSTPRTLAHRRSRFSFWGGGTSRGR